MVTNSAFVAHKRNSYAARITPFLGPLMETRDNYPKYVLSMDTLFGADYEGIHRIYLPDYLLAT